MKKSISVNRKSRGRPKKAGGVYPVSAVRLSPKLGAAVDAWASTQGDTPTRSEAIRRLVEIGLSVLPKAPNVDRIAVEKAVSSIEMSSIELAKIPKKSRTKR